MHIYREKWPLKQCVSECIVITGSGGNNVDELRCNQ